MTPSVQPLPQPFPPLAPPPGGGGPVAAPAATSRATGTLTTLRPGRPGVPRFPRQPKHPAGSRTPLFDTLARDWTARGATVPGAPDPVWEQLASWEHLRREIESTLRSLRLQGQGSEPDHPAWAPGIW